MTASVVVLPGDGVGPEVTAEALAVLEMACEAGGVELATCAMPMG
ncbi:MAG: 3-isopropylmalate dehydrogenase, partial [Candidatus Dormibacteraeota bacterium]|nr:3-isopropylmalate dehydrogenase [Candidatus Dormibacteraeota bacterium]